MPEKQNVLLNQLLSKGNRRIDIDADSDPENISKSLTHLNIKEEKEETEIVLPCIICVVCMILGLEGVL